MSAAVVSVESFLQAVAADLPGPGKHRAAILAELNDGLLEATESHQHTGLDRAQAVRLAIQEFGDPHTLARSFQPELTIAHARRSALTLLTAAPIVLALWIGAARARATPTGRLFDSTTDHITAALLLLALTATGIGTLLMSGRLTRWLALPPRAPAISAAVTGIITVIADMTAVAVLGVRLVGYPGTPHVLLLAAAITASCASIYLGTHASRTCLALATPPL